MQRMPETSCPNALSAPCSLCPPRETNFLRPFTTISASGATLMAALVTYASSTFTSCAKTARSTVPASGNTPCSTSSSSKRIFFGFLVMRLIIAKDLVNPASKRPAPQETGSLGVVLQRGKLKRGKKKCTGNAAACPIEANVSAQKHAPARRSKHQRTKANTRVILLASYKPTL